MIVIERKLGQVLIPLTDKAELIAKGPFNRLQNVAQEIPICLAIHVPAKAKYPVCFINCKATTFLLLFAQYDLTHDVDHVA